ncbi:unnamed protein product, partial [Amoebophrya sp. A25]
QHQSEIISLLHEIAVTEMPRRAGREIVRAIEDMQRPDENRVVGVPSSRVSAESENSVNSDLNTSEKMLVEEEQQHTTPAHDKGEQTEPVSLEVAGDDGQ